MYIISNACQTFAKFWFVYLDLFNGVKSSTLQPSWLMVIAEKVQVRMIHEINVCQVVVIVYGDIHI